MKFMFKCGASPLEIDLTDDVSVEIMLAALMRLVATAQTITECRKRLEAAIMLCVDYHARFHGTEAGKLLGTDMTRALEDGVLSTLTAFAGLPCAAIQDSKASLAAVVECRTDALNMAETWAHVQLETIRHYSPYTHAEAA